MVKIVSKPEPLRRVDLPKAFGTSSKFNKDKMVRSAAADRGFQSIIPTTGCSRGYSKLDPPRRILFNISKNHFL